MDWCPARTCWREPGFARVSAHAFCTAANLAHAEAMRFPTGVSSRSRIAAAESPAGTRSPVNTLALSSSWVSIGTPSAGLSKSRSETVVIVVLLVQRSYLGRVEHRSYSDKRPTGLWFDALTPRVLNGAQARDVH